MKNLIQTQIDRSSGYTREELTNLQNRISGMNECAALEMVRVRLHTEMRTLKQKREGMHEELTEKEIKECMHALQRIRSAGVSRELAQYV